MIWLLINGFLFLLALNAAVQEALYAKAWPHETFKYVVWMGVPLVFFIGASLGWLA